MARQEMINLDTLSLSGTHGWYITTKTYCPPARGWTGGVGRTELPCSGHGWDTVLIQQQAIDKVIYQITNSSQE